MSHRVCGSFPTSDYGEKMRIPCERGEETIVFEVGKE